MNTATTTPTNTKTFSPKLIHALLASLTTVGMIIMLISGGNTTINGIGALFTLIGLIAAFTYCPIQLFKLPVKLGYKCFKTFREFIPCYGRADLIAGLTGILLGTFFGAFISYGFPVIFTLRKYRRQNGSMVENI